MFQKRKSKMGFALYYTVSNNYDTSYLKEAAEMKLGIDDGNPDFASRNKAP